jgi:hypothetical protein
MATNKKKTPSRRDARSVRIQQIIFVLFGLIVILSMLLNLVH